MSEGFSRFRRADRLLCAREFTRVSRVGQRAASSAFVVLAASAPSGNGGMGRGRRLGITVSRKVGNAVVRNRIKRQVREWFRNDHSERAVPMDLVVIARRRARFLPPRELRRVLAETASAAVARLP